MLLGAPFGGGVPNPLAFVAENTQPGSSTVNLGKNFGTNAAPKGTVWQFNNTAYTAGMNTIFIPQAGVFKLANSMNFGSGQNISLNSTGWTGNLYPGNSGNSFTSVFAALLNSKEMQYGTYVGNGSNPRYLPHNLTTFPGVCYIVSDGYTSGGFMYERIGNRAVVYDASVQSQSIFDQGAPSTLASIGAWSQNSIFRVPDACNVNGRNYYYLLFANSGQSVYCGEYNTSISGSVSVTTGWPVGAILTKGSSGGNYVWLNPYPKADNFYSGNNSLNSFWQESGQLGQASQTYQWFNSTGFTTPNVSNSWFGNNAGDVYFLALRQYLP